jgi:hypothetical protein
MHMCPPLAVTYFGPEATSPPARLLWMLPGAAGQTSSKKKKKQIRSLRFFRKNKSKKKDKKRSKYLALDFSAHFLFFIF